MSKLFEKVENQLEDIDSDNILNEKYLSTNPKARYVVLINAQNFNNLESYVNITRQYFKIKEKRNNYLLDNFQNIYDFCLFLEGILPPNSNISLIENCDNFQNEKKNNEKFYILPRKNDIIKALLNQYKNLEDIYYFERKNDSFIFFCGKNKEFKIKKKDKFWKLIGLVEENTNILKILYNKIKKTRDNLDKYKNQDIEYREFYLFNENWLISLINNKNNSGKKNLDTFRPNTPTTGFMNCSPPINFGFIEKNEQNLEIIKKLEEKYSEIKEINLHIEKIFFVYSNYLKNSSKTLYFGIIDKDFSTIFFYSTEKINYSVDFILKYNNEDISFKEIKNKIIKKGIETYLFEMGIELTKSKNDLQKLVNLDLEEIGEFLNINLNLNNNISNYSRQLEMTENTFYYNGVIQCLVNIDPFKKLFLNRNKTRKIIGKNQQISFLFYKLMQYMWIFKEDNDNDEISSCSSDILLLEIINKTDINDIFKDIKSLIEFLLLSMHCEQKLYNNTVHNAMISYKIDDLRKMSNEIHNSFIKKNFFFEIESDCCNNSFSNCILYFTYKDFISNSLKNQNINLETILSKINIDCICKSCGKKTNSKLKFKSLPEILIIICPTKSDYNVKYSYKEKISLKKYYINKKNCEYELICTIIKSEQKQAYETYCKSSKEKDKWYHYKENDEKYNQEEGNGKLGHKTNFFNTKKTNSPYLLIYRKIANNK